MVDTLITLFESTSIDFSTNGLGCLPDAVSCSVVEERNGEFELEMVYPVDGLRYGDILLRRILLAKPNPYTEAQPFRIYAITKPINGLVTVNAEHISYDLSGFTVSPFTASSVSDAFVQMKTHTTVPCPFTFWTNKDVISEYEVATPSSVRSLLGGTDGSILSHYGKGEYEFDRYQVKLWLNRGSNRGFSIRYGKNLTDLEQEENNQNVYTGIHPFWYSDDNGLVELPEKIIQTDGEFNYSRILPVDFSDKWQDKPTEDELRTAGENYIKSHDIGIPKVSLKVSFVQLEQTEEYKNYALLETVHLCDTVNIEFPKLKVKATSKCIRTVYNVLSGKYAEIELGDASSNLASTISEQTKTINDTPSKSFMDKAIDNATKRISGVLGGYVLLHSSSNDNHPDEILIMDTDNVLTATKVWRWNSGGLGYSSTGYNGPYGLAMTMDGEIVADFVKTGSLNAIEFTACSMKGGSININDKFTVDAYGNTHVEGYIFALSGVIGDCYINDGVFEIPAANIINKITVDQIDANGIVAKDADLTGKITAMSGVIGGCEIVDGVLKVKNANISEKITATNIDINGIVKAGGLAVTGDVIIEKKRAVDEETKLAGLIEANEREISAKVSKTGGKDSSFSWSLSTEGFVLKANNTTVMNVTSTGLNVSGNITNGYVGMCYGDTYVKASLLPSGGNSPIRFYAGASTPTFGKVIILDDGSLYATNAKIGGEITAEKGVIGGCEIVDGVLQVTNLNITGKLTFNQLPNTVASTSDIPTKVSELTNDSKFQNEEGVVSIIDGTVTADYVEGLSCDFQKGKIGGWTISINEIYSGSSGINTGSSYQKESLINNGMSPVRFYCGNGNRVGGNFVVLDDGSLYATAAKIEGTIIATSGELNSGCKLGPSLHIGIDDNGLSTGLTNNQNLIGSSAGNLPSPYDSKNMTGFYLYTPYDNNLYGSALSFHNYYEYTATGGTYYKSTASYINNAGSYLLVKDTRNSDRAATFGISTSHYSYSRGCVAIASSTIEDYNNQGAKLTGSWYSESSISVDSDSVLKFNISHMDEKYNLLFDALQPRMYKYINGTSGRTHTGYIAQEVESALLSAGLTTMDFAAYISTNIVDEDGVWIERKGLRYEEFIALNTWQIQKLKARITKLEEVISKIS